jgi:hypothetical protein
MIIALAALLSLGVANAPHHGAPPAPVGMDVQPAGGPS